MNIFAKRKLASVAASFLASLIVFYFFPLTLKIAAICLSFIAALLFAVISRRFSLKAAICATAAAAGLISVLYFNIYVGDAASNVGKSLEIEGEIENITYQSEEICYFDAAVLKIDGERANFDCHFTSYSEGGKLSVGTVFKATARFCEFDDEKNGFDQENYYRSKGIFANAVLDESAYLEILGHNSHPVRAFFENVRSFCTDAFEKYTNNTAAPVLNALIVGDKSGLEDSVKRDFSRAGVSHMLAISGMHLAVIMSCVMMFADLFSVNKHLSSVFIILFCIFYMIVAGMGGSVLRSGIMFIIMSLSNFARRRADSLTSLFLAVFLITAVSPSSIFNIGLILSFSSTFGIIVITGPIIKKLKEKTFEAGLPIKLLSYILISIVTTLSAVTFSLLPMILFFESISVLSVLSNLILSPIATIILFTVPIFLICSPIVPMAYGIGYMLGTLTNVFTSIVSRFARVPGALISIEYPFTLIAVCAFIIAFTAVLFVRSRAAFLIPLAAFSLVFSVCLFSYELGLRNSSDFVFSSTGGNDAVLIRDSCDTVYIDFGKGSLASAKNAFYLLGEELYSPELDIWVVSHYTNKSVYTISSEIKKEYVRCIYLPVPLNDAEITASKEIEYNASRENTEIMYFKYNEAFLAGTSELIICTPHSFDDSSSVISECRIFSQGKEITYMGRGSFDYMEIPKDNDLLFLGSCGTKKKQRSSPVISCGTLVYDECNDIAVKNISSFEKCVLDDDRICIKKRIE